MENGSITDKSLHSIGDTMRSQDEFGIEKYGKPLKSTYNYDWLEMIQEELADGIKYLQCEKERKEQVIMMLDEAAVNQDWDMVYDALRLLRIKGMGK